MRTPGGKQIARRLHHDRVGPREVQPREAGADLRLDKHRTAISARGLDHHAIRCRAWHDRADDAFAVRRGGAGVEDRQSRFGREGEHVAHFGLRRATARRTAAVQAELGHAQPEFRNQCPQCRHAQAPSPPLWAHPYCARICKEAVSTALL